MPDYCVYILHCADGAYYVGHTQDLAKRLRIHREGRAAVHTRVRRPFTLVYSEDAPTKADAVRRERQIKRWTRAKKQALIAGDLDRLHHLSKRRKR